MNSSLNYDYIYGKEEELVYEYGDMNQVKRNADFKRARRVLKNDPTYQNVMNELKVFEKELKEMKKNIRLGINVKNDNSIILQNKILNHRDYVVRMSRLIKVRCSNGSRRNKKTGACVSFKRPNGGKKGTRRKG